MRKPIINLSPFISSKLTTRYDVPTLLNRICDVLPNCGQNRTDRTVTPISIVRIVKDRDTRERMVLEHEEIMYQTSTPLGVTGISNLLFS